jgi:hypothetical protein
VVDPVEACSWIYSYQFFSRDAGRRDGPRRHASDEPCRAEPASRTARFRSGYAAAFTLIRLAFARYLTLALELQLAADILSTSVAPTWDRIGKLAAIAVIRTALNYFLSKEVQQESREEARVPDNPAKG